MKKSPHPELAQTINRHAHMLAVQSFSAIRATLEDRARVMLKGGKSLDETLKAIQAMTRAERMGANHGGYLESEHWAVRSSALHKGAAAAPFFSRSTHQLRINHV